MKKVFLILITALLCGSAFAQTGQLPAKKKQTSTTTEVKTTEAPPAYQFTGQSKNVDADRPPMKFKVNQDNSTIEVPVAKDNTSDEPFKTYIGYPKHQLQASLMPVSISSKWEYGGQEFNYSNSTVGFDLQYRALITPQMDFEFDVSYYVASIKAGAVAPYVFTESDTAITNYMLRYNYYWISQSNFHQRWGPGIELGYNSFPLLDFVDNTTLEMNKMTDLVLGLYFNYSHPILPTWLFLGKVGATFGTGVGNEGRLSTESNTSYYIDVGSKWTMGETSAINASVNYAQQDTEVSGKISGVEDRWNTSSGVVVIKAGYTHTF